MIQADMIIYGNAIFTGNGNGPFPGAIAIKNNRILKAGTAQEVYPYLKPGTKTLKYGDELIIPGLHDSHIHLYLSLILKEAVDLTKTCSEYEAAKLVAEYARKHPEKHWIFGTGWHHANWGNVLPSKKSLDSFIPDRPVFLMNATGHGAWVNSTALKLSGITRKTPDPPFGKIGRDSDGNTSRYLYEKVMALTGKYAMTLKKEDAAKRFREFLRTAAEYGITSVDDMIPITGLEIGDPEFYHEIEKSGELTTRINFHTTLSDDFEQAWEMQQRYSSEKLRFSGLKEFVDGVATTHTAYLVDPYYDDKSTRGATLISEDYLEKCVLAADARGYRVRLHAVGDGAVRLALDCFENTQKQNGYRDARHTVEHIEIVHPDDINRFAELGVIPSIQPEHMAITPRFKDHPFIKVLGKEREPFFWVGKSFSDTGAPCVYGTDFPVASMDPFRNIHRAVTRQFEDGKPSQGWNPGEKVSVADTLKSYTKNPAYAVFRENELGTIEEGKLADIVVLDRNLFTISPDEINDVKVLLTVMDGKIVHKAGIPW